MVRNHEQRRRPAIFQRHAEGSQDRPVGIRIGQHLRYCVRRWSARQDGRNGAVYRQQGWDAVAHFHKTQGRVLLALGRILPWIDDAEWVKLYNVYATRVNDLSDALERRYGERMGKVTNES